jgi:hypothetical protein
MGTAVTELALRRHTCGSEVGYETVGRWMNHSNCAARCESLGDRGAGDGSLLDRAGFSLVLAMEVAVSRRQTDGAARNSPTDPRHEALRRWPGLAMVAEVPPRSHCDWLQA